MDLIVVSNIYTSMMLLKIIKLRDFDSCKIDRDETFLFVVNAQELLSSTKYDVLVDVTQRCIDDARMRVVSSRHARDAAMLVANSSHHR